MSLEPEEIDLSLPQFTAPKTADSDDRSRLLEQLKSKPLEIIQDWGSSSGAGSGDFHCYVHMRAREKYRLAKMHHEAKAKQAKDEFEEKKRLAKEEADAALEKRRNRRQKRKQHGKEVEAMKKREKKLKFADDGSFMDKFLAMQKQSESNNSLQDLETQTAKSEKKPADTCSPSGD